MSRPKDLWRGVASLWKRTGTPAPARRRNRKQASFRVEDLEGRVVLSSLTVGFGGGTSNPPVQSGLGSGGQRGGGGPQGAGGCQGGPGGGAGTSSLLGQDARAVQQAFQTFDSAYLAAVAALRQTATTTTAPTAAGLSTFDAAIASAVTALDKTVATDLGNLTNTGAAVAGTIDGLTATLQAEVDSAATGLANSTNASVLAMNREVNGYLQSAEGQSNSAILSDTATGTVTSSVVQTYKQAAQAAYQAFNTSIANAEQTSISGGTALSSTAVEGAVATLQTALTSAVSGLGTAFTSSTFSPTSAVTTDLTNLTTALEAITAPTASNTASVRLFLKTVNATLMQYESQIEQVVATAVQNYNNSLL